MFQVNHFKILLICLALGQICLAKPTNNEVKKQTSFPKELCEHKTTLTALLLCEDDNEKTPSLELLKFTVSGLTKVLDIATEKAQHAIDQILSDQELLQIANNDEVKIFIQKLQDSQEICHNCGCFKLMERMLDLFLTACADYYKQAELDKLSSDGKEILRVMKKYNVEKMLDDYDTDVNNFMKKFDEKYENLKESNYEENNKIVAKIGDWYEEFKTIKNGAIYGKKINSFRHFFNAYRQEFLENKTTTA